MQTFSLFFRVVLFFLLLITTSAAPLECDEIVAQMPNCTLPTIVQCNKEPPICTAVDTRSFPDECWKCKNKSPATSFSATTRGSLSTSSKPMTREEVKAICHAIRQEVNHCVGTVFKCGSAPAHCGDLEKVTACPAGLMICEGWTQPVQGKSLGVKRIQGATKLTRYAAMVALWLAW